MVCSFIIHPIVLGWGVVGCGGVGWGVVGCSVVLPAGILWWG